MNLIQAAMSGNQSAVMSVVNMSLPRLRGHLDSLEAEITYRRKSVWMPEEQARELAMNGEVTPEQASAAFQDLFMAVLRVCAYTPLALVAGPKQQKATEEMLVDSVYSLILTMHNPVVKYGIVGGYPEEIREEVADYLDRIGIELWGTLRALTSEGEINAGDFPPETAAVIEATAEAYNEEMAREAQQATRSAGDADTAGD